MLPIWRALLPLASFAAGGAVLDHVLALDLGAKATGPSAGKWVRWSMCGLIACFAAAIHPIVLAGLLALGAVGRIVIQRAPARPPARDDRAHGLGVAFGLAAGILGLVVICRPSTLVYWDSFVWLAKGRIESNGWGALRAASLDRSADVIPSGYPLLWPLASSWLSMGGHSMEALAAGAAAMTLATLALFLDAVATVSDSRGSEERPRWAPLALVFVATTPLVFVHLRSAYADLPVGLLAATCSLRLARCLQATALEQGERRGDLAVAAMTAAALAGLKDEGMAHVAALAVAVIVLRIEWGRRVPVAPAIVVMAAAAIPFNGWRMLLLSHHVANIDHRLSAPDFASAGAIARAVLSDLADVRSWGALWPIALVCTTIVLARRKSFRTITRFAAVSLAAQACILFAALLFGPDRVRIFAFEGTLINRLLIQLAPPAGALVTLALGDAAAARNAVRRPSSLPIGITAPQSVAPVSLTGSSD